MSEEEKMLLGKIYDPMDSTLVEKIVSKPKNVKKITIECKYIKDTNPNSE